MEERNLTLQITNGNWDNWVVFLVTILPFTDAQRESILKRLGEKKKW
jgi:hypothetical protein